MKKSIKILALLCVAALCVVAFAACNGGQDGLSAYDIAVKNGFEGSEKEWLNSLVGQSTVQQTVNNFTVNGKAQDLSAASNTGLKSVVSVLSTFTVLTTGGSWFYPTQQETEATAAGAGVIYKTEGSGTAYIITNYHVVYNASSTAADKISTDIKVFLYGMESEEYGIAATYVGGSMYYDIAVLKVNNSSIIKTAVEKGTACAASFANSDEIDIGQTTIAIGNPTAGGISVTSGIVSVDSEYITMVAVDNKTQVTYRAIRTDTAINSGNSGGGLFDGEGKLVGIVNAKMNTSQAENIAYAIPSNLAKIVAENIIRNCDGKDCKTVMRPILGITSGVEEMYTEVDPTDGMIVKVQKIKVQEVTKGSLAENELLANDILESITINGVEAKITRLHHITESLLGADIGDTVVIKVLRDNKSVTVELRITADCVTEY